MLTNYQQLIISLAPYAPALALCDPSLLTGYTNQPSVQLIKVGSVANIRITAPGPTTLNQFLGLYGVQSVGANLSTILSLTPDTLIDLDSIATGVVDLLVTGPCQQLQDLYPMKSDIVCYDPKHEHLQMLISVDLTSGAVVGYNYYSRNFNEDFCVINVYHYDAQGGLLGISTETWYDGPASYNHFNLRGINVYQATITGSHRNDWSRIYLTITPPADVVPTE